MGFKSRQPRRTNTTPSRHAFARVTRRDKRLGRARHRHLPRQKEMVYSPPFQEGKRQTFEEHRPVVSGRLWVLCQDAEVYQQRLLCDSTAEIHARHTNQHPPRPAMLSKCQTLPKTWLSPPRRWSPAHRAGSVKCCLAPVPPEPPGQTLRSLRCARPPFLPSHSLTHSLIHAHNKPHTV